MDYRGAWSKGMTPISRMGRKGTVNIMGAVVGVIMAIVGIAIGIIIANEMIDAFNSKLANDADFGGSWNTTKDMTASGFNLLPVVIIIIASIAVISAVLMLGGRS